MPDRLNQIVAGEPSLGTPHAHIYQFAGYIYSNLTPVANTFYTVTVAGLPAGTKMLDVRGFAYFTVAGPDIFWRPFGSADTMAQSEHRRLGIIPIANSYCMLQGLVTVDSSGRFEIAASSTNVNLYIEGYSIYWC